MSDELDQTQLSHLPNNPLHVTMHDVASLAGVSIKTVSRVVNNQGEIKETTRQRVQAAIDKLGYRPNILARSLIHQRSNTLAVVAWGIDYFGPSRVVVGIEQQANALGYSLTLSLVERPNDVNHMHVLDMLIARRVDGIVWAVPDVENNRAWVDHARPEQLPPIVFLFMEARPGLSVVTIDNRDGARQATQHLIDQGRRRIGIITGPLAWWEARERYAGWQDALRQSGLESRLSLVANSDDWSAVNGEQGMRALLEKEPGLDAVFACNDQIALGVLGSIHQLGRRIPQDLAVVGFDNTPESAFFWPPLTTVDQRLVDVGGMAVQSLHQMIAARRLGEEQAGLLSTVIQPELIIRASSTLS
jgi:LacI family transcriptional regulator